MQIRLGDKEHVAGWCFEGWIPSTKLAKLLLDIADKLEISTSDMPLVYQSDSAIRVELPNIVGTTYKFTKNDKIEERIRILVVTPRKIPVYEIGTLLRQRLNMFLLGKGTFSY